MLVVTRTPPDPPTLARRLRGVAMTTVLTAQLTFAIGACDGPCPEYEYNPPPLPIDVTVLDAATGAVLCDAQIALTAPCSGCLGEPEFVRYAAADASCGYQVLVALSGPTTISILASGYAPKTVTVNVASSTCGPPAITTATVRLSRACETLTSHDDGLGETWSDCTPAHTYSRVESTAACSSHGPALTCTQTVTCPLGNGAPTGNAVCDTSPTSGEEVACDCWTFQGAGAGHVRASTSGCECASDSDPSWF